MKKPAAIFIIWFSFFIFLILIPATPASSSAVKLSLATATSGGVFYQNGIAMGELSRKGKIPGIEIFPQASGGSSDNVNLLGQKEVHLAMVHNSTGIPAFEGTDEFKGKAIKNLRVISAIWKSVMHYPVLKAANINSIADYRGKTVQIGPIGSGIEKFTLQPLSIYGITAKDVKGMRLSVAECVMMMQNNQLDAFVHGSIIPDGNISQLMLTGRVKLIGMEPDKIQDMSKKYPMYAPASITANSYKYQEEEIKTTASFALLMAREDIEEGLIYNVTNALFENHQFLVNMHSSFKDTTLGNALFGGGNIPFHPGAARYYREKGLIK